MQKLQAIHAGHAQVADNDLGGVLSHQPQGFFAAAGQEYIVFLLGKGCFDGFKNHRVVINEEYGLAHGDILPWSLGL